jgi:hypothetical protein
VTRPRFVNSEYAYSRNNCGRYRVRFYTEMLEGARLEVQYLEQMPEKKTVGSVNRPRNQKDLGLCAAARSNPKYFAFEGC